MNDEHREDCSRLNRRAFIGALAGAAVAGAGAPGLLGAGDEKPWKMRLSTSSIHYSSLPIEQACARISKLGFEAIDIWSAHNGCPHLDDVQKRLGPGKLKALLKKNNLKLYAFSVYRGGYPKYAELLGKSGGGVAIRGSTGALKPGENLTARMRAFFEALKPEIELAEKHKSQLAIENHGHALLDSVDSLKAFTDLNQSKHVGIALAPYHVQGRKESVPAAIEACGGQLLFFYAWQRAGGEKQLPGIGPTDFAPWLAALEKVRYRGYVNPFMHHEPAPDRMDVVLAKSKAYLEAGYRKLSG
jgi:sugar phosphate isomerase/epimerase